MRVGRREAAAQCRGENSPPHHSRLRSRLNTWKISFAAFQFGKRERPPIAEMVSELIITQHDHEMFIIDYFRFGPTELPSNTYYAKFGLMLTLIDSLAVVSSSGPATIGKPLNPKSFSVEWGVIHHRSIRQASRPTVFFAPPGGSLAQLRRPYRRTNRRDGPKNG